MSTGCPACYCVKRYCRRCKGSHCGCSWNTKAGCTAKAKEKKAEKKRIDAANNAAYHGDIDGDFNYW